MSTTEHAPELPHHGTHRDAVPATSPSAAATVITSFAGTYTRRDGQWVYAWGAPVPHATDVTVIDALRVRDGQEPRTITETDVTWACRAHGTDRPLLSVSPTGARRLVVGMAAPEVQVSAMLTVADVSELAGVSKATIDSYRYRGTLPDPQVVLARTPLWARPIVVRWLRDRPGAGWRTDVHRAGPPQRTLPITRAREQRLRDAARSAGPR